MDGFHRASGPEHPLTNAIGGHVTTAADPPCPASRIAERRPVKLGAGARRSGGHGIAVLVTDLSTHGFCIETHLMLWPGADLWLRLPGLESRHAHVAWTKGPLIGCAFSQPLHPAVVEMLAESIPQ